MPGSPARSIIGRSTGRARSEEERVPSLTAGLVASLAGWMVDDLVQPYLGMGFALFLSFASSTVVFYVARNWLIDLRGR
jgi:hypothetical protein